MRQFFVVSWLCQSQISFGSSIKGTVTVKTKFSKQRQFGSNTQTGCDVEKETVCERRRCRLFFIISSPVELNKKIIPRFWCRKCCCFQSPQHSRRCPRWTAAQGCFSPAASLLFLSSFNSSSPFLNSLCLPCVGLLCGCSKQPLPPGSRLN